MASTSSSQNLNTLADRFDDIATNEDGPTKIVIFHLDTTDRNSKNAEICQIAAQYKELKFQEYLMPNGLMNMIATETHGFKLVLNGTQRRLNHYGQQVNAVSPEDGFKNFLNFLSNLTRNTRAVLLAANNCSKFHRHIIVRLMKQYNLLDTFKSLVLGFIDTEDVFKEILPNENSYELKELAKNHCNDYNIPDQIHAVVYVDVIVSLIKIKNCSDEVMEQFAKDLDEFIRYIDLKEIIEITDSILQKIAKAGITTDMLKNAYRGSQNDGISKLLQARVNVNKSTIKKINDCVKILSNKNDNTSSN